ncbi:hypothetical protein [Flavitalea sp.]|nr:hypothetical protein [Flavitalea sp.]
MKQSGNFWFKVIALTSGLAILVVSFLDDYFFDSWLVSIPVFLTLGGLFLSLSIWGMLRQNDFFFKLFLFIAFGILVGNLYDSEVFKSPRALEAELKDDLSRLSLILRENNDFELSSQDLFSTQVYAGKYVRNNNQIIF